jgi:hypothetical protein
MVMSSVESRIQHTQHAFLVAWGWFAEHMGLPQRFQAVSLKQKRYHHTPQTKVLELLVAILGGLKYLQDISLAAHPLDKDQAVAEAWGQAEWADYSGVSRTMSSLSWQEARQIAQILEEISQPYIDTELHLLRSQGQRIRLDGDLTGIPVSNTSQTYPNAAFGHMDDEIRLGYPAAVISLESPAMVVCGSPAPIILEIPFLAPRQKPCTLAYLIFSRFARIRCGMWGCWLAYPETNAS